MAKKINFESFKYRFLIAAQDAHYQAEFANHPDWLDFVRGIEFNYEKNAVGIAWKFISPGNLSVPLNEPKFYVRGDSQQH